MRARSLDVASAGRRQGFSMHTRKEMIRATTQSKGDMFLELTLAIEGFGARATLDVDAEHVDEGPFFSGFISGSQAEGDGADAV